MAPSPPDRSLLDRLNALKPSGLDGSSPASTSHVTAAAPDSPADALAARLRLLRQQREPQDRTPGKRQVDPNADPSSPLPPTAPSAVRSQGDGDGDGDGDEDEDEDEDDDDPLLFSDEQALNAFLAEDDDAGDAEDDGESFILLPDVPSRSQLGDDADDEKKVDDLLESLGRPDAGKDGGGSGGISDADGDDMAREVQRVVDQARDEAGWTQQHEPEETRRPEDADADDHDHDDDHDDHDDHDHDDPPLRLPAVPTRLVDPPDAADDIAARLAALRGLTGPETGLGQTDAFGLPSAPTFQPADVRRPGLRAHGRVGYSDADRRSWCVVCLEDAAVRCLGCDDDPYCARCWREMHVGPAAGFDERGHKRVPFCRPAQP